MRSHSDKTHKGKEVYPVNYSFCPALGAGESIDQAAGGVMQRGRLQLRYKVAERVPDKGVVLAYFLPNTLHWLQEMLNGLIANP